MTLTKKPGLVYTPAVAGSPGDPGSPPTPGYYSPGPPGPPGIKWLLVSNGQIIDVSYAVSPPPPIIDLGTVVGGITVTRPPPVWTANPATAPAPIWVPPSPGRPPVPPVVGSPAKTTSTFNLGWNSGAISVETRTGDTVLSLKASSSSVGIVAGLNQNYAGNNYQKIGYGLYFTDAQVVVYENGIQKTLAVGFSDATEFQIRRVSGVVSYYQGATLLYTSTVASNGPVFADASLYAAGDSITAASFSAVAQPNSSASLRPLGSLSSDSAYSASNGVFSPLGGSSADSALYAGYALSSSSASLRPLGSLSSDSTYADSRGVLTPLGGSSADSDQSLRPSYALTSSSLLPLQGFSVMLSGKVGSVNTAATGALQGLSSDYAYAESRGSFQPLQAYSLQIVPVRNYLYLTAPMATVYATGHDSTGENAGDVLAPMATVTAFGGGNGSVAAPMAVLVMTGTVTGIARGDTVAPMAVIDATGLTGGVATIDVSAPMAQIVAFGGAVGFALAPMATVVAGATTGAVGYMTITAPMAQLSMSGTAQNHGILVIAAPMARIGIGSQLLIIAPMARIAGSASAVIAVLYEAYSINLKHKVRRQGEEAAIDETTRYTNFPFDRIVRYQGNYFGVAADGLYLLEGTTDFALPTPTAIPYAVKTCIDDFSQPEKKSVAAAYFGGRLGPAATVTLYAGETGQNSYAYDTPRGQTAQNHREKFGRGVKDRYFAIGVAGTGELELDMLEIDTAKMNRRI